LLIINFFNRIKHVSIPSSNITIKYRVFQKTAESLNHHNYAIVSHKLTWFSPKKQSDVNWKQENDSLNTAFKHSLFSS